MDSSISPLATIRPIDPYSVPGPHADGPVRELFDGLGDRVAVLLAVREREQDVQHGWREREKVGGAWIFGAHGIEGSSVRAGYIRYGHSSAPSFLQFQSRIREQILTFGSSLHERDVAPRDYRPRATVSRAAFAPLLL